MLRPIQELFWQPFSVGQRLGPHVAARFWRFCSWSASRRRVYMGSMSELRVSELVLTRLAVNL